jgi:hypothetical protein
MADLRALMGRLSEDTWRHESKFSDDILAYSTRIIDGTQEESETALREWLSKFQPCIFGKAASGSANMLDTCVVREADIRRGDQHVRRTIQDARLNWKHRALAGESSGFVVLAATPSLLYAEPNHALMDFARHFCSLHLQEDVRHDVEHYDRIRLDDGNKDLLEWHVGVNAFASAGDRHWWHDHRVPGGVAFSMNSVGHLVKSSELRGHKDELADSLGAAGGLRTKFNSLEIAHLYAMLTIAQAQRTADGTATRLLPMPPEERDELTEACPFHETKLPRLLEDRDYREYAGWYHTDWTVPSDYFQPAARRPDDIEEMRLDFRYLYDDSPENLAHQTMGRGVRSP